ncbi:MAG: o-succinylbenzoate synthase [Actinomycetales bacterium]|nr:o-succinylbenzoate synthase [Actinomycetales bacterium]
MADVDERTLLASAIPFALRMRQSFRGIEVREGMLIQGPSGWGEFAPFDDYDDRMAARWLGTAIEAAFGDWPVPRRTSVAVNAIIPAVSADAAAVMVRDAVLGDGCTTVKVKVGTGLAADEARVASVRHSLDVALGHGRGRIRLDANAAWSGPEAITALRRLGRYGIEYVEQPCASAADLRQVRASCDVPIAIDEHIRQAPDLQALREQAAQLAELADLAIIKPTPMGGIAVALAVVASLPIPVVVSGAMESSVGLAVPTTLAGILDLDIACGLGTGALLATDVVAEPIRPIGGLVSVARRAPDLDALLDARNALGEERGQWWRERLRRAWAARESMRA